MPTLESIEKEAILHEYKFQGYNKTRTAQVLGIAVNTLVSKLEKYGAEAIKSAGGEGQRLPFYNGEIRQVASGDIIPTPVKIDSEPELSPKKRANR